MDQKLSAGLRMAGAAAALALAALPGTAGAQSVSSNLNVTANVTANCTVSTSPIAFGSVNTLSGAPVNASGGVTVTCTNGTLWTASADQGQGAGASFTARRMSSGSNTLAYNIFTDSARTIVWGDGSGSSATVSQNGSGAAQSITVFGQVPAGQSSVPAGSYSDTVAVTISY
jgi:spore coat protein U-like protein